MKYKLVNNNTEEKTLCDKVTIDGFDYYVISIAIGCKYGISKLNEVVEIKIGYDATLYKGIICSNNPNINIPKVVDEVDVKEYIALSVLNQQHWDTSTNLPFNHGFIKGYTKSQETHPFSEDDMIEFAEFYFREEFNSTMQDCKSSKELFQLWKEQQPKIVYYD
jgi:hypothetical protein